MDPSEAEAAIRLKKQEEEGNIFPLISSGACSYEPAY